MTQIPLATSASVTLDANGRGILSFGPAVYGSTWDIDRIVTSGNSNPEAQLTIYRNGVSTNSVLDSTASGNSDVDETGIHLVAGENVQCLYTGGNPGAVMTVTVYGVNDTGREY